MKHVLQIRAMLAYRVYMLFEKYNGKIIDFFYKEILYLYFFITVSLPQRLKPPHLTTCFPDKDRWKCIKGIGIQCNI